MMTKIVGVRRFAETRKTRGTNSKRDQDERDKIKGSLIKNSDPFKCNKRGSKVLSKKFCRRHIIAWLIATVVILSSSLVVRNNNESLITIAIVVVCTTIVVLIIPTLADVIHKLIDDLDTEE